MFEYRIFKKGADEAHSVYDQEALTVSLTSGSIKNLDCAQQHASKETGTERRHAGKIALSLLGMDRYLARISPAAAVPCVR